jgi:hypothetical protein
VKAFRWIYKMKAAQKLILGITTVMFLLPISRVEQLSANTAGQSPKTPDPERHREENERDLEQRTWNLRLLSEQPRKPSPKRPMPEQAMEQLQKDFTRLQIVNKSLLRAALGNASPDPGFVLKSVVEIRQCAERLNANLALPELEPTDRIALEPVASPQQLKPSVLRLGRLIFSFVDNPFFKEASVFDTRLTTRAKRDLEDIIELSGQIKEE